MIRKLLLVSIWFPLTFLFLIGNLAVLAATIQTKHTGPQLSIVPYTTDDFQIAASSGTSQVLGTTIVAADARSLLLESFLRQHGSPMAPYAETIVQKADENGIDFRLVVAIAMCESNLGKHMPSRNSYNAWGISVYSGQQNGATFPNWTYAIEWVSKYIKEKYYDRGLIDLKDIGAVWAPPSVEKGYSWTNCVASFQKSIL